MFNSDLSEKAHYLDFFGKNLETAETSAWIYMWPRQHLEKGKEAGRGDRKQLCYYIPEIPRFS